MSDRIYCGALPSGVEAFQALRNEGIHTVISVDGARPDLEGAHEASLRYVHLPIGYAKVPLPVMASLQELLKSGDDVIYIHCHHGKHRGPAAAAVAAMLNNDLDQQGALGLLEAAGTGAEYDGLWRDVREFKGVPDGVAPMPLREQAPVSDLVAAMSELDHTADRLKALLQIGEEGREEAVHESLLLMEAYREMARLDEAGKIVEGLKEGEKLAAQLRRSIAASSPDITNHWRKVRSNCTECHRAHRN